MGQTLRLNDVLASLDSDNDAQALTIEKTASAHASPSQARQELQEILARGRTGGHEKTASDRSQLAPGYEATPAGDLEKIAEQVQAAETEALVKEAHFYGQAVCDGFMSRLSQYQEAAGIVQEDAPSGGGYYDDGRHEKVTAEVFNDIEPEAIEAAEEMIKEASEQGFELSGEEALEKIAQHQHSEGATALLSELSEEFQEAGAEDLLEKMAEDFHEAGYEDLISEMADQFRADGFEDALEKIAEAFHEAGETEAVEALTKVAFEQGYEDAMEKIAESAFNHGYADMSAILDAQAA